MSARRAVARVPVADDDAGSTQTERALLRLRELIVGGELASGERVPELALVERLGVSRTPVRAALQRLQEEGLLELLPGGGFAVRGFDEADIHDAIEVRATMEALAARLAAERGEDERSADTEHKIRLRAVEREVHTKNCWKAYEHEPQDDRGKKDDVRLLGKRDLNKVFCIAVVVIGHCLLQAVGGYGESVESTEHCQSTKPASPPPLDSLCEHSMVSST